MALPFNAIKIKFCVIMQEDFLHCPPAKHMLQGDLPRSLVVFQDS